MFRDIIQTTSALLRLATDVQENREEIKAMRTELRDLVLVVERMRVEQQQAPEREARERQLMMVQVENLLLRERQALALPQATGSG